MLQEPRGHNHIIHSFSSSGSRTLNCGAERRAQIYSAPTGAAGLTCCYDRKENNTDLSPDEVKLGVTLHTSGTLEAEGKGEKQDVTQCSCRFMVISGDLSDLGTRIK